MLKPVPASNSVADGKQQNVASLIYRIIRTQSENLNHIKTILKEIDS
jgi:uncharacterized protein (DUF305 family)